MATNLNKLLVIAVASALAFLVIRPFLTALVFAAVMAHILYPMHYNLSKKISEKISVYLLTAISAALVILTISYGATILLTEISRAYLYVSKFDFSAAGLPIGETARNVIRIVFSKAIEGLSGALTSIPKIVISFFIFFISLFYFLKDGRKIVMWAKRAVPLPNEKKEIIFKDMQRYTYAFVYVWGLIGLLQGIAAVIGFYIFGLPYLFLAGLAAAIFSILPIVGPGTLYIPTSAVLILSGNINAGIGLLIYGLVIGNILDYIIRPYLASKELKSHPLLILVGILGGLSLIGPAGIIIGPVILLGAAAILKGVNAGALK